MYIRLTYLVACLCFSYSTRAQYQEVMGKAAQIIDVMAEIHDSDRALNDSLSADILASYLSLYDPFGTYFNDQRVEALKEWKYLLDDEIRSQETKFLKAMEAEYLQNDKWIKDYLSSSSLEDLRLESVDTVVLAMHHYRPQLDLEDHWRKTLKSALFMELALEHPKETTWKELSDDDLSKAFEKIVQNKGCYMSQETDTTEVVELIGNLFLNAICTAYDPHSAYFSMDAKEEFISGLEKDVAVFGFNIMEDGQGTYSIVNIIPGSAAWFADEFEEGVELLGVYASDDQLVLADCEHIDQVSQILNDDQRKEVLFLLRTKDGKKVKSPLSKSFDPVEANIIKSYILGDEQKVALVQLPSFYTEGDGQEYYLPNGCANDIAKELIQLQREGISGVILDLRDNGGGAILEALRLSGSFIDYGPVALSKYVGEEAEAIRDMDRGQVYSGPMAVLVNSSSASASELFAAAMQDYHRAVIVGSKTHGKGTIQTILPLGPDDPDDFLKVTVGKYGRVTGEPVQQKGVVPDVQLPDYYDHFTFREIAYRTSLKPVKIDKKIKYRTYQHIPTKSLQEKSTERILGSTYFKEVQDHISEYESDRMLKMFMPVSLSEIIKNMYEEDLSLDTELTVRWPSYKSDMFESDTFVQVQIDKNIHSIKKDPQVEETYFILLDLINHKK